MTPAVLELESNPDTATAVPLLEAGPATEAQRAAWETFQALPMPARTDEAWRFSNIKALSLEGCSAPLPLDEEAREALLARTAPLAATAGRMVSANDQLLDREIFSDQLRQHGVIWLPLDQARAAHPALFERFFMRQDAILGGRKFAALHASQVRAGTFLYLPRNVEVDLPIEAIHWLHGHGSSCFPHTLIIAEAGSKATIIDSFESSTQESPGFACAVNDLWVGDGAQISYVCTQNWSRSTLAVQLNSAIVGRDASAKMLTVNLGSRLGRTESVSHLRAPGGRSDMLAVTLADGTQEMDQRTFQIHESQNTTSDLLYKNALDDQARTIFSGLIRVAPGAHQTDAYQKVRNLLLSDDAEANSMPGLEIEADNVRCTHGATSGQIEEEELFYLLSRGIHRREAQRLIVHGFLDEVLDRLGHDSIASHLRDLVHAKFDSRH
jgi:Fe-S cluster assembly protein SufD